MKDDRREDVRDAELERVRGGGPQVLGEDLGRVSPDGVEVESAGSDVIVNAPTAGETIAGAGPEVAED